MTRITEQTGTFHGENVDVDLRNTRTGYSMRFSPAILDVEVDSRAGVFFVVIATTDHPDGQEMALSIDRWTIDATARSSGGGCILTTACVTTLGLPDDCAELTAFRSMRDGYLRVDRAGVSVIEDYYRTAPMVIEAVTKSDCPNDAWAEIYRELVQPVTELMELQRADEAVEHALRAYGAIKDRYGVH